MKMKRILLAEDNSHMRELIQDYLSENGFEVDAKADGLQAWEAIQTQAYHLVLLAKCRAILERDQRRGTWLEASGIRLNPELRQVFCDGEPVWLQSLDFELLQYFMKNPGRALTREQILLKLCGSK